MFSATRRRESSPPVCRVVFHPVFFTFGAGGHDSAGTGCAFHPFRSNILPVTAHEMGCSILMRDQLIV